jgi:hypothetical protein
MKVTVATFTIKISISNFLFYFFIGSRAPFLFSLPSLFSLPFLPLSFSSSHRLVLLRNSSMKMKMDMKKKSPTGSSPSLVSLPLPPSLCCCVHHGHENGVQERRRTGFVAHISNLSRQTPPKP